MNLDLLRNKLVLAMALMTTGALSSFSQQETTVVKITEDTFVSQQDPSTVQNGSKDLGVAIDETNGDSRETYLKFDITDLVGKGGLVDANLSIEASVKQEAPWSPIPDFFLNIYACTKQWSATTLTWANKVEADPTLIAEGDIQGTALYVITGTAADNTGIRKAIEDAMKKHSQFVSFVLKGKKETAGSRIWVATEQWIGATLNVVQDFYLDEPGATGTYITSIKVKGSNDQTDITTDNGTLQMAIDVLPIDADNKNVVWSIQDGGTGRANINKTGLLTALSNGTVTVTATAIDGSYITGNIDITISGQSYSWTKRSYLKDGTFETEGPISSPWNYYSGTGEVIGGVLQLSYTEHLTDTAPWAYNLNQVATVPFANKDKDYILTFKAWSDEVRTLNLNFQDANNGYGRYGNSSDSESNGTSDWTFNLTTTPHIYVFHVNFTRMQETCSQTFNINYNSVTSLATVYMDSIALLTDEDYILKTSRILSNSIKVFPNPVGSANELTVSMTKPNDKVTIYNSLGQKMMEKTTVGNIAKFDVSSLLNGMYIIKLSDGTSQKFIK